MKNEKLFPPYPKVYSDIFKYILLSYWFHDQMLYEDIFWISKHNVFIMMAHIFIANILGGVFLPQIFGLIFTKINLMHETANNGFTSA